MGEKPCRTLQAESDKGCCQGEYSSIAFNLSLGKDIAEREAENKYGTKFYAILSKDLKRDLPDVEGLSESNIRYCKRFYQLYKDAIENLPQLVEISDRRNLPQLWKNCAVFRVDIID